VEAKIYADFNGIVVCPGGLPNSCLDLTGYGTLASLSRHRIRLSEGLVLTFYEPDDIEVEAEVFYDTTHRGKFTAPGRWLARFNSVKIRNSEVTEARERPEHLCFTCRLDLTEYLRLVGRQYNEACPSCGTSVMHPLLPPGV
jgi:hypothetical protein